MPLSWNEIKSRALQFTQEWKDEVSEDAEAKSFWDDFFNVFGISRRFNIEDAHLSDTDRIDKLVAIVSIAFTWAYKAGIYAHQNIKPIVIKKHKRKAHSFFKYGLRFITNALLVRFDQLLTFINVLSCT